MKSCRVHIMGASGSGTTTLGRALADRLAAPHHDCDDYYWLPTSPPFREKRPAADRLRLMEQMFLGRSNWVLSGSLDGWGNVLIPLLDLVVFVRAPTDFRLMRLRDRETRHFGAEAVSPGGWRHDETEQFIDWASHYDDGSREGRTLTRHEAWLKTVTCPTFRADGARAIVDIVQDIVQALTD